MKRFRLYIDESGDHTYKNLEDPAKRYLGLLGLVIESEIYRTEFHPVLQQLKQKHFPHDPDHPLVLHREDIINKRGLYKSLLASEKENAFNEDLLAFLLNCDYRLISVVIDKKSHVERYGTAAFHPYHYCLVVLLERYCGYLNLIGGQGDVMAESRGGVEDKELKRAYKEAWELGTQFKKPAFFQKVLTSKEIKLEKKEANIAGLQIADILAHPVKQNILVEHNISGISEGSFGSQICRVIAPKYNKQKYTGEVKGYGKRLIK